MPKKLDPAISEPVAEASLEAFFFPSIANGVTIYATDRAEAEAKALKLKEDMSKLIPPLSRNEQ